MRGWVGGWEVDVGECLVCQLANVVRVTGASDGIAAVRAETASSEAAAACCGTDHTDSPVCSFHQITKITQWQLKHWLWYTHEHRTIQGAGLSIKVIQPQVFLCVKLTEWQAKKCNAIHLHLQILWATLCVCVCMCTDSQWASPALAKAGQEKIDSPCKTKNERALAGFGWVVGPMGGGEHGWVQKKVGGWIWVRKKFTPGGSTSKHMIYILDTFCQKMIFAKLGRISQVLSNTTKFHCENCMFLLCARWNKETERWITWVTNYHA